MALTDYADRYIVDRLCGAERRRQCAGRSADLRRALRIWLDTNAHGRARPHGAGRRERAPLAERGTAGGLRPKRGARLSGPRRARVRDAGAIRAAAAARAAPDGAVVRLGDISRIEIAPEETRRTLPRQRLPTKSASASSANRARTRLKWGMRSRPRWSGSAPSLPEGAHLILTYDSTLFIDRAIQRVGQTLLESTLLVVFVIFLFLGIVARRVHPGRGDPGLFDRRVPGAVDLRVFDQSAHACWRWCWRSGWWSTIPLSCSKMRSGASIRLGEPPLLAAERGTRQVFFAVVATSAVLVAVFVPLLVRRRLCRAACSSSLAVTIAGVVVISAFASLSLSPMMCSKLIKPVKDKHAVDAPRRWLAREACAPPTALRWKRRSNAKPVVFAMFALRVVRRRFHLHPALVGAHAAGRSRHRERLDPGAGRRGL